MTAKRNMDIVDLFCGCGGLSLGAHQAGFETALAVDVDPILTSSFARNFKGTKLLHESVSTLDGSKLLKKIGGKPDGVVGGPPCQSFSAIGAGNPRDPRRKLVRHFFRVVAEMGPKFFVMENVRGITFRQHIGVLDQGISLLPKRYRILDPLVLDCADFGAPTSRPRIFVIGYDSNEMSALKASDFTGNGRSITVRDAIGDLRQAKFIGDSRGFDIWSYDQRLATSPYANKMRGKRKTFSGNRRTLHQSETIKRFDSVDEGSRDEVGKHARLAWTGRCPTLRAGTGSDRGSYQSVRPIHPSEPRVITVREAARLQGFPDHFVFHPTIWHSFRMIGNSVSPIIARALFSQIRQRLEQ